MRCSGLALRHQSYSRGPWRRHNLESCKIPGPSQTSTPSFWSVERHSLCCVDHACAGETWMTQWLKSTVRSGSLLGVKRCIVFPHPGHGEVLTEVVQLAVPPLFEVVRSCRPTSACSAWQTRLPFQVNIFPKRSRLDPVWAVRYSHRPTSSWWSLRWFQLSLWLSPVSPSVKGSCCDSCRSFAWVRKIRLGCHPRKRAHWLWYFYWRYCTFVNHQIFPDLGPRITECLPPRIWYSALAKQTVLLPYNFLLVTVFGKKQLGTSQLSWAFTF